MRDVIANNLAHVRARVLTEAFVHSLRNERVSASTAYFSRRDTNRKVKKQSVTINFSHGGDEIGK